MKVITEYSRPEQAIVDYTAYDCYAAFTEYPRTSQFLAEANSIWLPYARRGFYQAFKRQHEQLVTLAATERKKRHV